jgi:peptide deformylase
LDPVVEVMMQSKLAPIVGGAPMTSVQTMESGVHRRAARIRPVLEHPNAALSTPSYDCDPLDPAIVELTNTLITTMRSMPRCVGLSAVQVGENVRLFCMDVTGHKKARSCAGLVALANPRILSLGGNVVMREGCASVPNFLGDVARAATVVVAGLIPGSGRELVIEANAIEARCLLHEIDHLDGILFVDRVLDPTAELHSRRRSA